MSLHPQPSRSIRPARVIALTGVLAVALLGGCGEPPWATPSESTTTESTDSSTSPSETSGETSAEAPTDDPSSPAPTLTQIVNDLASGSTVRTLTAGSASLTATYWSDLDMASWTPDASKPVSLSLTATNAEGTPLFLSRLHVVSSARDAAGALVETLPELVDDATVTPGYTIEDPFSYSTTVLVPALPEDARSVELTFSYEILVATDDDATAFAKQTATDTITVAVVAGAEESSSTD